MNYQNFDLEIIATQGGTLRARVLESPQGDCPFVDVKWPFNAEEENALLAEIYGGLTQRRARSTKLATVQEFGGKLFDAVFASDIEHLFRSSLDAAVRVGKGLRIRLRLPEDGDLHGRPWEFLFDTESREFLAVREHTPLVRYLPVAQPVAPITVEGPLRILVALSAPTDHPRLDISREWDILWYALEPSINAGHIELRRVPGHCTFDNLRDSLRNFGADIFHFVGHGVPGALVLEQESGKGLEMEATHLRSAFRSGALPRLIVLNACSGALAEDAPFSGLAQGFLRQGVPAVVAMQASITDDAALILTRYFYRDLVDTGAVDASLTEARLRMQGNGHPIEWGTPVLYMRALSGQLFQPRANPHEHKKTRDNVAPPPVEEVHSAERKTARDVKTRENNAPPPQPAATTSERKPPREPRPKDAAPAPTPPAAVVPERKKPRPAPVRENLAPPHLEPDLKEPDSKEPEFPFRAPIKTTAPPMPEPGIDEETSRTPAYSPPLAMHKRLEGRPLYWLSGGVLLAVLTIAFGVHKIFAARDSAAVPLKSPAILATPSVVPKTTPPPMVSSKASVVQAVPQPEERPTQRQASAIKPVKPTGPAARKGSTSQKRPVAADPVPAPDQCKDTEVGSRSVDCLFKK